jgi:hypothetical protein
MWIRYERINDRMGMAYLKYAYVMVIGLEAKIIIHYGYQSAVLNNSC